MSSYVSPGVYIRERDLSAYVAALSTTSCGFTITATRGPINEPQLITSAEQFLATYGQPNVNHYGPYAVLNYLKNGNQAWVNRVAREYDANAASIIEMGDPETDGTYSKIVVAPGHGLSEDDYIRVTETGKRTSQNLKITDITLDSPNYIVTVDGTFLEEYTASADSDSSIAVSAGAAAVAPAEVFAYGRRNGASFPLVKFTAKDPGAFANFGTNQGIEIVIEDGGQYQNVDPVTGEPVTSDGIPLQGLNTSAPSVDTKIDLLRLIVDGDAVVGETRGVNYDSLVGVLALAKSANGNLVLVIPLSTGWAVDDVVVVTESDTALYDGTYDVLAVTNTSTTTELELDGFAGALPGVYASGTLTSSGVNVSNNDTVTLGVSGGSKIYTFKTTLTPTEGEVLIGADAEESLANLVAAVTHTGTPGTDYQCAAAHTQVTAVLTSATVVTFTSLVTGTVGNTYGLAKSAVTLTVSDTTLLGGTATDVTAGYIENTSSTSHKFGTVYRCAAGSGGNVWVAQGVLAKRVTVKYKGQPEEIFDNVIGYDSASANYWDTVIGTPAQPVSQLVTAEYIGSGGEQPISSYSRTRHPNNPRYVMGLSVQVKVEDSSSAATETFDQAAGYDGDSPTAAEYIGENTEDGGHTGLQLFRNVEAYDISILVTPGVYLPEVVVEMIAIVDARHDCLAIIDPPLGLSVQEVVDWHNGTGVYTGLHTAFVSNKAALYYPWVHQFDPYTNRELILPPTCFMPGVFAYNDQVGESWYAPAGITRGTIKGALKTERVMTRGDMDYMYGPGNGNGVNPIATYAKDGIVVWGQRTLQRHPSSLDRVNVRRLLFFIEKSIATATRFLSFEQNDPILWNQFKDLVTPFLDSLLGQRALEDYIIVCDATTNTPLRRNNNEFYAKIAVVPVKSAEKIILDIAVLASGIAVTEFIANDTGTAF